MPTIRKLTPDEIAQRNRPKRGTRQLIAQEYDALIAGFQPGEWGELELAEEENRLTVRNRLIAAASRRELHLVFHRTTGNLMRFVVAEGQAEPPIEAKPGGKKRGRKPKIIA